MRVSGLSALISLILLSGCHSDTQSDEVAEASASWQYSTKAVYQAHQALESYQSVPDGYEVAYTQLVARHGSRALSSPKYDVLTMKVWEAAARQGAVTELGEKLSSEVLRIMQANEDMGYGNLSGLGKEEHAQLAERFAVRHQSLLNKAVSQTLPVDVESSGVDRAVDSAANFSDSLKEQVSGLSVSAPVKNPFQLYFHKKDGMPSKVCAEFYPQGERCAQYQAAYDAYQDFLDNDSDLEAALDGLKDQPKSKTLARTMLERLYTKEFVDYLEAGVELVAINPEDGKKTYVRNEVDAALMLYNLFIIGPGMQHEAGDRPWELSQFVSPEESAWFSYLSDAEDFYEKGPSFVDQTVTYDIARTLLDDMFLEVQTQVVEGPQQRAAKLRFAHAETIIPLVALMQLEGSRDAAEIGTLMTQENNEWRGGWVSPYTANIQWDVLRKTTENQRDEAPAVLVKMLYNEKEMAFKTDCQPVSEGSFYYDFAELKRCYRYQYAD